MITFIVWIGMGALVGWIASLVLGTNGRQGALMNIVIGIVGASVGGALFRVLGANGANINEVLSPYALIVSLVGAVIVIAAVQLLRKALA